MSRQTVVRRLFIQGVVLIATSATISAQVPQALFTDPPSDSLHPARMEVLHIPSGGVKINGVAYLAPGANPKPVLVLLHGLPGNEKNLDLAHAVRRAGWHVVTFNYRGSWGSPGEFRFGNNLEDANAVLAFLHDSATAERFNLDAERMVIAGHSMGGWVTALTAAKHPELLGAILISAADFGGGLSTIPRQQVVGIMASNMEALAGVTAESMADDLIGGPADWSLLSAAQGLARMPMLVFTSDDGLAPHVAPLVAEIKSLGNERVTSVHKSTDHSWSGARVALASSVINWLLDL
jgi:pimeloyl-ACP methyl ester carboxylesterase